MSKVIQYTPMHDVMHHGHEGIESPGKGEHEDVESKGEHKRDKHEKEEKNEPK